ncbi:MAG TPA: rhodanese-like domain-containing protein [Gemmatimonadaceae bacterium]|nr:rhodanese-like domain-containing protein [Gemmatimonadaceae bacterium]
MIFKRFYDDSLAQASYMIGCEKTREAIVVDPTLDTGEYVRAAGSERLKITDVTETHIHADFISGSRALADTTGAHLHLSGLGGREFGYTDSAFRNASKLKDGSVIEIGRVILKVLHTPGHTPEHISFLVSDLERGSDAVGVLTGDFIFVGDVGRPDLLERAAGAAGTMKESARALLKSLRKFRRLPDHLQLWPGHGAGSACGKALGQMPQSTLGYEKLFNWAFAVRSESEFVAKVLEDQPVPPAYFAEMKRINREPPSGRPQSEPGRLSLADVESEIERGSLMLDIREAARFAAGHIPGALNIPYNKSFLNWCGALVPADRSLIVVTDAEDNDALIGIRDNLRKIGRAQVAGFCGADVVHEWRSKGAALEQTQSVRPADIRALRGKRTQIVDVRAPDEWRRGHLEGALHIPLAALPERMAEIDASLPVVLHCKGGGRSAIATSFLQSRGVRSASNLDGGYERWVKEGFETVVELPPAPRKRSTTKAATKSGRKTNRK